MFYCCGITDKGIMPHNEDAFLIGKEVRDSGTAYVQGDIPFIAAVSDGVSGERSGEMASRMCLGIMSRMEFVSAGTLAGELYSVHNRLMEIGSQSPELNNMQTTLCGFAAFERGKIVSFNAGDSRLYLYRDDYIRQLTRDQSLVQMLYEEGSITFAETRTHVHRNIICPVFGNLKARPQVDIKEFEVLHGDIFILCTDGLSDYVSALEIQEILELPKSLEKRLEILVEKALGNGGSDNITIVAAVCLENNEDIKPLEDEGGKI
ncbi:MAG: serine/threonine-protein phosphatase [Ruminococcus sp.]|nr:serine/threonine-protein phosphatase [Ruminococcus sp.]